VYPRVLLAVSLLQKAVVADPGPFQDACARHLLPWLLDASAVHLYHKVSGRAPPPTTWGNRLSPAPTVLFLGRTPTDVAPL
jgi:hypothetical protein